MEQITYDIDVLKLKSDNTFEVYEDIDPELVKDLQKEINLTDLMSTNVLYARYANHVYGRRRCFNDLKQSRQDSFKAYITYKQSQLEANEDLKTMFNSCGGLLKL